MKKITCRDILEAVRGELICGDLDTEILRISTDSRKIEQGDLFVPIAGERFDGHDYIEGSLKMGALAAVTQKDMNKVEGKVLIRVQDTLKALGDIAGFYRRKFDMPFVGITGSVGKTSTKDMIWSVLSQKYNVLRTEGNFNNEIGLPLTMFNLEEHEVGVLEMGMSGFGEISRLTNIVKPDVAVITNIGMSHIEKLGSRQNILKAKMEIIEGLNKKGLLILNGDDNLLGGLKDLLNVRTVFYGMEEGHDYQAFNIRSAGENGSNFEISINNIDYKIHIPVPGIHNVYNALAAIAVGMELKVPMELIIKGISEFSAGKMRLNIVSHRGIKIINDAYNASPQSMEAAIKVLSDMGNGNRTIAVLGDMLEMGEWALKAHQDVGKFAFSQGITYIITVGENGKNIADGAIASGASSDSVYSFDSILDAGNFIKGFVKDGDVLLVKGSRGMKMEGVVDCLTTL